MSDNITVLDNELTVTISNMQSNYDSISKSLNDASGVIQTICAGVDGEISSAIKSKYSSFEVQYDTIFKNLESYIEDMKKVIESFENEQSSISYSEIEKDKGGELVNVKY